MSEERKYDLVILGATGYTGQYVLEEVARIVETKRPNLTYAVAGRNQDKLDKVVAAARANTGLGLEGVGVVVVDVGDKEGMVAMAQQAKVVINCVGPYRYYGVKTVEACVEGGASQVDISGEPQYLEQVQVQFGEEAERRGIYVVGSCGFDSIPADLGTTYLQEVFPGDLNSVEAVVGMDDSSEGSAPINVTTLECAVLGLSHSKELRGIRKKLFSTPLPTSSYKPPKRGKVFYSKEAERWCIPNMASDRSVVVRTQHLNYKLRQSRPLQFQIYFGMKSILTVVGAMFLGLLLYLMTTWTFTQRLLLKYPEIFTLGAFVKGGPKRASLSKVRFRLTLTGCGWNSKLTDPASQHPNPPNVTKTVQVTGPDPGYVATATFITQSALTILDEADRIPGRGGVLTPGAAFLDTTLRQRLTECGISFSEVN